MKPILLKLSIIIATTAVAAPPLKVAPSHDPKYVNVIANIPATPNSMSGLSFDSEDLQMYVERQLIEAHLVPAKNRATNGSYLYILAANIPGYSRIEIYYYRPMIDYDGEIRQVISWKTGEGKHTVYDSISELKEDIDKALDKFIAEYTKANQKPPVPIKP